MTELNASKAREILKSKPHPGLPAITTAAADAGLKAFAEAFAADGFMQAHALAERVLVKALEKFAKFKPFEVGHSCSNFRKVGDKALSEWRKANGE